MYRTSKRHVYKTRIKYEIEKEKYQNKVATTYDSMGHCTLKYNLRVFFFIWLLCVRFFSYSQLFYIQVHIQSKNQGTRKSTRIIVLKKYVQNNACV